MAEAVVGFLISKLGAALASGAAAYGASLLGKEASTLKGFTDEIRKAEGELEIMKAYLHDAEKGTDTNEATGIFIKKIRDLAFRIEDVVDEFTFTLEDDKHGGFIAKMKKRFKHIDVLRRLALELHGVNAELEDAAKKRGLYAMPGIERYAGAGDHGFRATNQTLCFVREDDLVGIEDNVDKLKQWLIGDFKERSKKIITVWGMGGVGKTTLVDHVYKILKVDFDCAAWVTVSKSYRVDDLLKKIVREMGINVDAVNIEMRSIVEVMRNHLEGKSYILVLDDVWDQDVWITIMDVFPTNCISRFVLTSRKYEVASLATSNCEIKLEPFGKYHSWKLFHNLALRNNDDKRFPSDLQGLATKFLQKCEGLPIAIACIGRLLSCKPLTYSAWRNVYEELELHSTKKLFPGVDIILKVSLEDLPYELKNCFLHCAMFPEDYEMKRERLIQHWITAGFIKEKENRTIEEVAEGYLHELVNRSLLQVVRKKVSGRVQYCRMHDVMRNLALSKVEKECFGKVYEGSRAFVVGSARRLSIQSTDMASFSQSTTKHLRAVHAFPSYIDIDMLRPLLASSNLLSTLDLQGTQVKNLPNVIFSLFNLRFLGLRGTRIEILPEAVGRLQNLEVLDAFDTSLLSLPKKVAKLKKLMFLYARRRLKGQTFTCYGGIKVPWGIRSLTRLHVLKHVKASLETLCCVAALTELRTFSVCDVTSEHALRLCDAIMNLTDLMDLSITASNENEILPLEALRLPRTISKLELVGQLEKKRMPQILSSWPHLTNLARLILRFSRLDEDSFCSLALLHGLCSLKIDKAYTGKKLYFSAVSFPKLRELNIWSAPQLNQVIIEEGALESLVQLRFSDCPELKCLLMVLST